MVKRRVKGTGTIYKPKESKNFYLKYTIDGIVKKISLRTGIKLEAEKKAKILTKDLELKTREDILYHIGQVKSLISDNRLKLSDVWHKFEVIKQKEQCSQKTINAYQQYWNEFLRYLPMKFDTMQSVTEKEATGFLEYLETKFKVSNRTYNAYLLSVSVIFKTFIGEKHVFKNEDKKILDTHSHKEFTKSQIKNIFSAFDDPELKIMNKDEMLLLFHFGCWTGLRLKDCCLIKWESINLAKNMIYIKPAKTQKYNRTVVIPLHPMLFNEIEMIYKDQNFDDYVLPHVAKRYLSNPSGVKKDCIKVFKYCGLKTTLKIKGKMKGVNQYGFHSFRHTFVSFCANAGVPLAVVQAIVGHGSPVMTRLYSHLGEDTLKNAINTLPTLNSDYNVKQIGTIDIKKELLSMNQDNWETIRDKILKGY